jgi:hypothetical protein
MLFRVSELLVNTAHFANNSRIQIEDNLPSNTEGTRRSAASPAPARGCAMPRRGLAEGLMAGGSKALSQAGAGASRRERPPADCLALCSSRLPRI